MRFDEHYFHEGGKIIKGHVATIKAEQGIVDIINKGSTRMTRFEDALKAIVEYSGLEGKAFSTGQKNDGELNETYKKIIEEYFSNVSEKQINRTYKTDIVVNEDKLSLKLNRGWIFAHLLRDSQACMLYVLNESDKFKEDLKQQFISMFDELKKGEYPDPIEKGFKAGYTLKNDLSNKFISLFEKNKDGLKSEFIKAALTGNFKFKKDHLASADKLFIVGYRNRSMSTDKALLDSKNISEERTKIYNLYSDDDYIDKLVKITKLKFIVLNKGRIRMDVNSFQSGLDVIEEGFFDNLTDLLKKGYNFAKDKIKKFIDFIIDLINKGVVYIMELLGLGVKVDMNNEIVFP
jgi:hypothetical protein